jgi:filamentous hemagglutinin family protein
MMTIATRPAYRNNRRRLLLSCATAAIAAAVLMPQKAHAQAFQGSITSATNASQTSVGTGTETITVTAPTATLVWNPTGAVNGSGNIDFLPSGNVATFQGTADAGNYTILNRVIPDGAYKIELNGTVNSYVAGGATGGNIWFYSPNGILVGGTAVFNVGGLLLTTADPGSNWTTSDTGFTASMGPAASGSSITVNPGAQINAQNSYVAMVAPAITQGGTVNVNGSAAYVAAEQLTMTFNQGLFDIAVDVGTDDPNGIIHTGTTTGTANATAADNHTIYMVAVPKNQALTMLLQGGRIGFGDAVSADVQNGQIVLSAGYSVGYDDSGQLFFDDPGLGVSSGINIQGGKYSSSVIGYATGDILANGGAGGTLEFDGDVTLQGLTSAEIDARDGDTITVGGNARVSADDLKYFIRTTSADYVDAYGGSATILAESGGSISIAGNATVSANASPTVNLATNYAGISHGGFAKIESDGGTISIGGDAQIDAIAFGDGNNNGFDGRDNQGGNAELNASNGGSITIAGDLGVDAEGDGSWSWLESGGTGGRGTGGYARVSADTGASISVGGTALIAANGVGQEAKGTGGTGGEGQGGEADLLASSGGSITFSGSATLQSNGYGDGGFDANDTPAYGGDGDGGETYMNIDGGTVTADGDLKLISDGFGGAGTVQGGDGYGGYADAQFWSPSGAGGTLSVAGDFRIGASGAGGDGIANPDGLGGDGGEGVGGSASFYATSAVQGDATINAQLSNVSLIAVGSGGAGGDGIDGGAGGSAIGGETYLDLESGSFSANVIDTNASGFGGAGGAASGGTGGAGGSADGGYSFGYVATSVTGDIQGNADAISK